MQMLGELYEVVARKGEALKDAVLPGAEGEVLVRKATNDEKWGPAGSLMLQIADMTGEFQHLGPISSTLWGRLSERNNGHNWRTVYKGLLLLEYILKNGSEQFINDARMHVRTLQELQLFHHVDSEGVDRGISIRERAKIVQELMMDTKALREERKKAKANRGKFTTSMSSSSNSRYSGFGSDSFSRGGGPARGRSHNAFSDSDDDLDSGTRNKKTHASHKTGDLGADWEPFPDAPATSTAASSKSGRPIDDDWADFASPAAASPPAPTVNQTADLLSGLSISSSPAPASAPANSNPFSAFATPAPAPQPASSAPADPFASFGSPQPPASSQPPVSPSPAASPSPVASPFASSPQPAIISLVDSPAKSAPTASSSKDPFDFGFGSSSASSKPLASTVSVSSPTPTPSYTPSPFATAPPAAPQPYPPGAYPPGAYYPGYPYPAYPPPGAAYPPPPTY